MKHFMFCFVVLLAVIVLISGCTQPENPDSTSSTDPKNTLPYQYTGETFVEKDGRTCALEATPENPGEEVIANYFINTILLDYSELRELLSSDLASYIDVYNTEKNEQEGLYIKSYTVHNFHTSWDSTTAEANTEPEFFLDLEQYAFTEYYIVEADFTQTLSEASEAAMPQWPDGEYSRAFLIGKTEDDPALKIYEFGMM